MGWLKRFTGKQDQDPDPQPEQPAPRPASSFPQWDHLPDLSDPDLEPVDGVRIGESPVPGLTLKRILRGHDEDVNRMAWSPDGRFLASPSDDTTVRIWDVLLGECINILHGHQGYVYYVSWSPDGRILASASQDNTIRLWDIETWKRVKTLEKHPESVMAIMWTLDSQKLVSATAGGVIDVWDAHTYRHLSTLKIHDEVISDLARSKDGQWLASSSYDNTICITNLQFSEKTHLISKEYPDDTNCVLWSSDQKLIISGDDLGQIGFWDWQSNAQIRVLEGHTGRISSIAFLSNERLLISKSADRTIRVWRADTWDMIAIVPEAHAGGALSGIAFHPHLPYLATQGEKNVIRIWEIDEELLLSNPPIVETVNYTTAKLVLVGDSGVGKTGLGWRLAHGEFKEHASTHGQQFWVVNELKTRRTDKTQCEAVLWDLAGQPVYRPVHSIFLDDVDLALLLFDPTKPQESLNGVEFWLKQLAGKKQLPPSVLIGARLDRGAGTLTEDELQQFCQRHGISGGYIGTSAFTGEGLDGLMERLQGLIPWDSMTTTVTTVTFKRVKDFVLALKEQPDREHVLVNPDELRQQLQATDPDWQFTNDEMMTAVGHLQTHGYVNVLRSSSGEKHILLMPDLLVTLVASIILQANKHPQSLGALSETALLHGDFVFDELAELTKEEREILLDAAVLLFIEHNICFRETLGNETLLIFPSQIQQKRPLLDDVETVDDVSYIVQGAVENVYSALVVLLGYIPTFTRVNQWQSQAQFEVGERQICSFRRIEERAGEVEFILNYVPTIPANVRSMFQGMFETFLYQRDVEVTRYPPVFCEEEHLQERAAVIKRLREGKDHLFCTDCGKKVMLPNVDEPSALGERDRRTVSRGEREAQLRRTYEMHLSPVKGFRRDRTAPRCFVSHLPSQAAWAAKLVSDLRDAGVHVLEDWSQLRETDFILLLTTPDYQKAWVSLDPAIAPDISAVQLRMEAARGQRPNVIPLLLEGPLSTSRPKELYGVHAGDFRDDSRRVVTLYDLVLSLYNIRFSHPAFAPLRKDLLKQWRDTLASSKAVQREIYISYGWRGESEEMANALDIAFQERNVTIIRDKRDLGFKGRIKSFMDEIGEGKCVILIISEKYLKSPNCCYELVQIAKNEDFYDRIFPIVLDDANIYNPDDRIRYVQHWEGEKAELDALMKTVSSSNMEGFREDIDLYTEIRALLPNLMNILSNMNTLTPDMHRDSGFRELFDAVMERLEA